jgi:hypothetical protein
MIRIAITAAFEAIAASLPLGTVGFEHDPDEKDELFFGVTSTRSMEASTAPLRGIESPPRPRRSAARG